MQGALDGTRFSKIHWRDVLPVAVLLTLAVFSIQYLFSFLRFPNPLEYREAASIILANVLHQGSNPFTLINYPQDMYIYGLLYPFFIAPWIGIVQPILLIPRLLNVIFLLLTCVLSSVRFIPGWFILSNERFLPYLFIFFIGTINPPVWGPILRGYTHETRRRFRSGS